PAPQVTVTSEVAATLPPSTAADTPTPVPSPTVTFTLTPVGFTLDQLANMSSEDKIAVTPDYEGFNKEVSVVKNNIVIYRDENGNAIKVFDLITTQELTLSEAGIIELDMTDGTKWEMQLFTDSEEALEFVAENTKWFEGDRREVGLKLKQDGKLEGLIQKNKAVRNIKIKSGMGDFPPFDESDRFFLMFTWEGPNGGLILSYFVDESGDFNAIFLDDPDILSRGALMNEIRQTKFIIPEN
ncbi:MAG: hypothetical protein Q8L87_02445, partial [Anaerolineales bacterium]|nr:hypothetical protein [Anaerolineales bacterium]